MDCAYKGKRVYYLVMSKEVFSSVTNLRRERNSNPSLKSLKWCWCYRRSYQWGHSLMTSQMLEGGAKDFVTIVGEKN